MSARRLSVGQRLVLETLRARGPMTRRELADALELSLSGLAATVARLKSEDLVLERPLGSAGRPGRPAQVLELVRVRGFGVGIDVGHSHVRAVLGRADLTVVDERYAEMATDSDPDGTLRSIREMVLELLDANDLGPGEIVGCGVGLPAPIDPHSGRVVGNNILPRWTERAPGETLRELLQAPVRVENDANLGGLAEHHAGIARDRQYVLYLKVAAGVGLGMVVAGRLASGFGGTAGEIGHLQVRPDGDVCRCGARGCLETVASVPRMCAALEAIQGRHLDAADLVELVRAGDPGALRVVSDAGRLVGRSVADLTTVLSPELIVINGELEEANHLIAAEVRAAIDRFTLPVIAHTVEVAVSTLGRRAEATGALHLAFSSVGRVLPAQGMMRASR